MGVAGSWNELCSIIYLKQKKDWALLINDDVYLGYKTETVEDVINSSKVGIVQSLLNFSVLLLNVRTYVTVGVVVFFVVILYIIVILIGDIFL